MTKKILVTGFGGFLGQAIVKEMRFKGISCFSTTSNYRVVDQKEVFYLDLLDKKSISNVLNLLRPQVIVHTGALLKEQDPMRDIAVNLLGSVNLLIEAAKLGLERFIFSSSGGAIYGEVPEPLLAHPSWSVRPLNPYATSKLAFEQYLHTFSSIYGFEYNILRYSNIIGRNQPNKGSGLIFPIFLEKARQNQILSIFGRDNEGDEGCYRDYIDVENAASANLLCITGVIKEKIINISSGEPISTLQVANAILRHVNTASQIEFSPPRPGEVKRSVLDNSDLKKYMNILDFNSTISNILAFESKKI
jgi:UDP-glucose 4-epimerase